MHEREASILDHIAGPSDMKQLSDTELTLLANELRSEVISAVSETGGHLGSSLGVVEITVCLLYTSPSPRDSDSSRMPSSA